MHVCVALVTYILGFIPTTDLTSSHPHHADCLHTNSFVCMPVPLFPPSSLSKHPVGFTPSPTARRIPPNHSVFFQLTPALFIHSLLSQTAGSFLVHQTNLLDYGECWDEEVKIFLSEIISKYFHNTVFKLSLKTNTNIYWNFILLQLYIKFHRSFINCKRKSFA